MKGPEQSKVCNFSCIYKLLRWGLAGIFVYAGSVKLLSPESFAVLIEAYGILPDSLLLPVAIALPALEVAAGIGLFFDIEGSLAIIASLLALFIAFVGYGVWLGLDIDCGCFGPKDPEATVFHHLRTILARDLAMLAVVAGLFGWRRYHAIRPIKISLRMPRRMRKRRLENAAV